MGALREWYGLRRSGGTGMGKFFAELKRRHIYRVAAAYAVVAWILIQLVNNIAPALRLPEWAPALVIVLLLVGFPVTMLIAWTRELPLADEATARAATGRLDWALMGALLVVIGLVSYQQLAPTQATRTAQQGAVAPASSQPQPGGISVAVLPFANLSGDAGQEFFSDGMTEEITSALAKVPSLRVQARATAFQ
jgi:adenylate cyclase